MLPQEANFRALGQRETNYIYWDGAVNNIKTSVMPPLHYAAPSTSSFKHTLGCSNLRGSSLMSGDLRCSFAPAHLHQMISSSTSNLLTLIPPPHSLNSPPPHPPLCFLHSCHPSSSHRHLPSTVFAFPLLCLWPPPLNLRILSGLRG